MARNKSFITSAAILAAATVHCDGRIALTAEVNDESHHHKRKNRDRKAPHARDQNNHHRRQNEHDTVMNVGIAQYETMAQYEPLYQASHYEPHASNGGKSGKSSGKSHKEKHHHLRPPQHHSEVDVLPAINGNADYDDVTFTWSQDDVVVDQNIQAMQHSTNQNEMQQTEVVAAHQQDITMHDSSGATNLSPHEILVLQYENMMENEDDDTGAFQWFDDDVAWVNDGHDDNYHHTLEGKATKLFKHGVHFSGKSGKGSKAGSDGGEHIWGGGYSGKPSVKPSGDGTTQPPSGLLPTTSSPTKDSALIPTTSPPISSKLPTITAPSPSPFQSVLPPLTWMGVDNCSFLYPCEICAGDCDSDSDCQAGLHCFKRGEGEKIPIPGCAAGGVGDIPGADYCFDPAASKRPTSVPSQAGSKSPTSKTTLSPTMSPVGDLPSLTFVGVNGCSRTSPCDICQGDCDSDEECIGSLTCFKRADGMKNQVPGCDVGGRGDIAGADYCHDENGTVSSSVPSKAPTAGGDTPSMSPVATNIVPTSSPMISTPSTSYPSLSSAPSFVMPFESEIPSSTAMTLKYLIRSRSRTSSDQESSSDWCASGALSPDYYQLMLSSCIADTADPEASTPIRRIQQMDQLWTMDGEGLIHSIYDYERCMTLQSDPSVLDEASVEIGPCDANSTLQQFVYDEPSATLKLQGDQFSSFCMTYLGETASKGTPLIMEKCELDVKFGWDFVSENMYGQPSPSPTVTFPMLKYNGRDGCKTESPCDVCTGDCDKDSDCEKGLMCFQRAKDETSQVPGCELGGVQDIPGADYCYDPKSPLPPLIWLGESVSGCSKSKQCNRCTGSCRTNEDCVGNLECFKRRADETNLIPGCRGGGEGDIPGK